MEAVGSGVGLSRVAQMDGACEGIDKASDNDPGNLDGVRIE